MRRDISVVRDISGPIEISTLRRILRDPSRYLRGEGYFGAPQDIYVARDTSGPLEKSTGWRIFRDLEISTWRGILRDPSRYLRGEGYFGTPRDIYVVKNISVPRDIYGVRDISGPLEISQCHMFPFFQKFQRLHESEIWPALTCSSSTWHEYLRSHTKPI